MIPINLADTVLVFDLDDTLYPEIDYHYSGLNYILSTISTLYPSKANIPSLSSLIDFSSSPLDDIVSNLDLPPSSITSLLWLYRNHTPTIQLSPSTLSLLDWASCNFYSVCILTDGRSISQRLKLSSLGLSHLPVYISEEFSDVKPSKTRFLAIMTDFPVTNYIYVGDNPIKDFVAPNLLNWHTIGLRASSSNIHPQPVSLPSPVHHPSLWIDNLSDLVKMFNYD